MVKRIIIAIVLLALIGGGLVGFNLFRDNMIAQIFSNMPRQPATVSTVEAKAVTWTPAIDAIGTANAKQGVDLTVETAGVVKEILFQSNQQVEGGTLLLRLDDVVQQADVVAVRTAAELERANLARAEELQGRGLQAESTLEQSRAAAEAADAQLARAEAVLAQRRLVAPFAGTIGLPRVDLGQYVTPGMIVTTLQDLSLLRVDFSLPEQDLPKLSVGQTIEVRMEGVDDVFTGELTGIDPRVDPATRLVALRGTIPAAGGTITPGQFVRIRVVLPAEDGVIALPQTALSTSLYGDYVYVVRPVEGAEPAEDGQPKLEVRQVFVQPGRRSGGLVEKVTGLDAGAQVVTAGQNRLSNGQPAIVNNDVNPVADVAGGTAGGADQ